ncbi:helix-turn-helix transcriptional regulator [Dorea sp. NSJ-36]|uniref:Helix-turn-helix transcriptional regulator n=1 Tax=Dorea hominis TaxID=2763040 RepID=A0ABR7ERC3_9FIRM|nr:helix-turn-helix transcriptional regulator [Dorea hominis]MBC5663909.1 helix-turn-helix transcriptional regulator [Dorea hominis]
MLDITSSNSIVAIRLKEAITEKGLKQTSIANRAGYTAQELNDMLNGRRIMRAADISSILKVIREFGIDANYLFGIEKGE